MHRITRVAISALLIALLAVFLNPHSAEAQKKIVSLNKASVQELMALPCKIPETLAKAIVEFRTAKGPFKKPEDLRQVPGMTDAFLEDINPQLKDGDVVFDPDAEPAMAPSKC